MKKLFIVIIFFITISTYGQDQRFFGKVRVDSIPNQTTIDSIVVPASDGTLAQINYSDFFAKLQGDLQVIAGQNYIFNAPLTEVNGTVDLDLLNYAQINAGAAQTFSDVLGMDVTRTEINNYGIKSLITMEWFDNNIPTEALDLTFRPYLTYTETNLQGALEDVIDRLELTSTVAPAAIGAFDEGQGLTYYPVTQDRSNKGVGGYGHLDISYNDSLGVHGATGGGLGTSGFTAGYNNKNEGYASIVTGENNWSKAATWSYYQFLSGWGNTSTAYATFTMGADNNNDGNYNFMGGSSNEAGGGAAFYWGTALDGTGGDEMAFFGSANIRPADSGGNLYYLLVGNGTTTGSAATRYERLVPSDAFRVYRTGRIEAPDFDLEKYGSEYDLATVQKVESMIATGGGTESDPIFLDWYSNWVEPTMDIDLAADYDWTGLHKYTERLTYVTSEPIDFNSEPENQGHWMVFENDLGENIFDIGYDRSSDGSTNYVYFSASNQGAPYQTTFSFNGDMSAKSYSGVDIDDGFDRNSIEIGYSAGSSDATNQISLGAYAGINTDGWSNMAIGGRALENTIGDQNIGIGTYSIRYGEGDNNIGIGSSSGNYLQGNDNVSIGNKSAYDFPRQATPRITFKDTDVDTSSDWIYVPNHGLTVGGYYDFQVEHVQESASTPFGGFGEHVMNFAVRDADHIDPWAVNIYGDSKGVTDFNLWEIKAISNSVNIGTGSQPTESNSINFGGPTHTRISHGMTGYTPTYPNDLIDKNYADQLVLGTGGTPDQTIAFDPNTNLLTISGNLDTADLSSLDQSGENGEPLWVAAEPNVPRLNTENLYTETQIIRGSDKGITIRDSGDFIDVATIKVSSPSPSQILEINGYDAIHFSLMGDGSVAHYSFNDYSGEALRYDSYSVQPLWSMPTTTISALNGEMGTNSKAIPTVEWVESYIGGLGGTDDQTLSFSGTDLSIEGGNTVDLSSLLTGVNVNADWNATSGDAEILNKPTTITSLQASQILANNIKVGISTSQANQITANTAKIGISTSQAAAIVSNTSKVGITAAQASQIEANNNKVSFPEAPVTNDIWGRRNGVWAVVPSGGSSYTSGNGISLAGDQVSLTTLSDNWDAGSDYTITAAGFYEGSLRSIKQNITPFTKSALKLISALEIVSYDKIDNGIKNKIGVIVDDSPKEFANEDHNAVDLYKTIFIQAKAIQELESRLIDLENRVKKLEDEK